MDARRYVFAGLYLCFSDSFPIQCVENRVQFHRKEAEYLRWQEQVEMKHAEVQRVYAYFKKMSSIWLQMSETKVRAGSSGGAAYARRTAGMWTQFGEKMTATLGDAGVPELRNVPAGTTFVDQILARREAEISKFLPGYSVPPSPEPRFQSVEEVKVKYGEKVTSHTAEEDAEEEVIGEVEVKRQRTKRKQAEEFSDEE
jgi:hypothetical protein